MIKPLYTTRLGKAYNGDSIKILSNIPSESIDLVLTSPPFALSRKKAYGNVDPDEYCEWFMPFAKEINRILKPRGSFILEIAGSWKKGEPTRNLYHYNLLLSLCKPNGSFHLAQEFYWYNPAKIPAPAQWVNIERIRVKDSITLIWWFSRTTRPKASNRRVLIPYSISMENLLLHGYNHGERPSGHIVSTNWGRRNKGAIPANVIIAANTSSNDPYLNACRKYKLTPNPARFVNAIPEFFIRFLTLPGNTVLDPFAGSNVVGMIAERLGRKWISSEINNEYAVGSAFRFSNIGPRVLQKSNIPKKSI